MANDRVANDGKLKKSNLTQGPVIGTESEELPIWEKCLPIAR
jgi:hypothetical protein